MRFALRNTIEYCVAILIDRPIWPKNGRKYAHMVSDHNFAELHGFANRIGLPQKAFHDDHYDVVSYLVNDAISFGAKQVASRELLGRLKSAGLRRQRSLRSEAT